MLRFFECPGASDHAYLSIRDRPEQAEVRRIVEEEWDVAAPFLDPDLPARAAHEFTAHYWEVYLAAALLRVGLPLIPRKARRRPREGPDLQVAAPPTWIEAVVTKPGTGLDAVAEPQPASLAAVPHDAMKLRFINAITFKWRKRSDYVRSGDIREEDSYVVAINSAPIFLAMLEREVPRIVSSVYPIGSKVLHIDRQSGRQVGSSFEYQPVVTKLAGASVPTDIFLRQEFAGVSALIHAHSDAFNRPTRPGEEFIVVHNKLAAHPIAHGSLPCSREYRADETQVDEIVYDWPWHGAGGC